MGHAFRQKGQFIKHLLEAHQCTVDADMWCTGVRSGWKRQCGFCGELFSDVWNERYAHVSAHMLAGLRVIPDWKDPWTEDKESDVQSIAELDDNGE